MRRGPILVLSALLAAACALGLILGWTAFGEQLNDYAYDFLFRLEAPAPWQTDSVILALDEPTLSKYGGVAGIRNALAAGLGALRDAKPAAVAVDIILPETSTPDVDSRLAEVFAATPHLVLASDLLPDASGWEDPIEAFRRSAAAIGQVHADLGKYDGVSRQIPLEKAAGHERRWALSMAAYLVSRGIAQVEESPNDLVAGDRRIPSSTRDGRVMRIRYAPPAMGGIPRVGIADLVAHPELAARFTGKVVFVGITAQNAVRDRWMTPYSNSVAMPGIEMNASAYETIARGLFLTDASSVFVAITCLMLALTAGAIYVFTGGWLANILAALVIAASQAIPAIAFAQSTVWHWMPGTLTAVFSVAAAAAWRTILMRRELARAENEKVRYQKAMQFVTHEMRTPLTAIQGSSELISRYAHMPEQKRQQMAELIHSESKRLARMIETFLSVERLSAGQMEMKQERFALRELVDSCARRAQPLAEKKQIEFALGQLPDADLLGDRELMEYALYNLMTNAVKYSPPKTTVTVFGEDERGDRVRLAVRDQGIGMDKKEVSRIFEKFYRTKRAEQSGEVGTGIGLSIVEQIVEQHGGSIHVESEPGKGSQFTLVLKRAA